MGIAGTAEDRAIDMSAFAKSDNHFRTVGVTEQLITIQGVIGNTLAAAKDVGIHGRRVHRSDYGRAANRDLGMARACPSR